MLFKVTEMSDYSKTFGDNQNFCSVFHYGPDCGASRNVNFSIVSSFPDVDGAILTYNKKTEDIFRIYTRTILEEPDYMIVRSKFTKMDNVNKSRKVTQPALIPSPLQINQEELYAVIAMAWHKNWFIMRTCDLKITWVQVVYPPEQRYRQNYVDIYKEEVNDKLKELKIDISTMIDVPIEFPYDPPMPEN